MSECSVGISVLPLTPDADEDFADVGNEVVSVALLVIGGRGVNGGML